jgi:hypothetical protein
MVPKVDVGRKKLPGLVGWYIIKKFLIHQEGIKIPNV